MNCELPGKVWVVCQTQGSIWPHIAQVQRTQPFGGGAERKEIKLVRTHGPRSWPHCQVNGRGFGVADGKVKGAAMPDPKTVLHSVSIETPIPFPLRGSAPQALETGKL